MIRTVHILCQLLIILLYFLKKYNAEIECLIWQQSTRKSALVKVWTNKKRNSLKSKKYDNICAYKNIHFYMYKESMIVFIIFIVLTIGEDK